MRRAEMFRRRRRRAIRQPAAPGEVEIARHRAAAEVFPRTPPGRVTPPKPPPGDLPAHDKFSINRRI